MPLTLLAAAILAALPFQVAPPEPKPPVAAPTPAPVRLEGRIKDPAGKPVEKALVIVRRLDARLLGRTMTARSDATGAFSVTLDGAGDYALRVEASGLAPASVDRLTAPRTGLVVTLVRGATIEGVVKDARGRPVPNARVDARERRGAWLWPGLEAAVGRVRATTDARGAFRLGGLSSALQVLTASARGVGGARRDGVVPGQRVEIFLGSGAAVLGTVHGPDRRPLSGAFVVLESEVTLFAAPALAEESDDEGAFQFGSVPAGAWRVTAWKRGAAPALARVLVEKGAERALALRLGPTARLVGRLVDGEGRPQRGWLALQEIEGQVVVSRLGQVLRTESDEQGRFALDGLPRRPLAVAVTGRGFAARRIEASPARARLDLGNVVVERGLAIAGSVVDDTGQPVSNAHVSASGHLARRAVLDATTEADGRFLLSGADPGLYMVRVLAAGFAAADAQVSAGEPPLGIALRRAASIVGAVVDGKGAPVPSFSVFATPLLRADERPTFAQRPKFTEGTGGRLTLEDVAPGVWNFVVKAPDSVAAPVDGVRVVEGATTDVGVVRLRPGASVRGHVTDPAGSPVAGATVRAELRAGRMNFGGDHGAYTDAAGAFELSGLEAGRVDLVAIHPAFAEARLADFEVGAAPSAGEAHIVLARGGSIQGAVRRRDGRPVEAMLVAVASPGIGTVPVGSDGTFKVECVPAGEVSVSLYGPSGDGGSSALQQRQVKVAEGETTSLDFALRDVLVTGTILRQGAAAAGMKIAFRGRGSSGSYTGVPSGAVVAPPTAPQRGWTTTREDGGYELLVEDAGTYEVSVKGADGRMGYGLGQVQVPDADTASLDFTLGGVVVTGTAVDAETGAPLRVSVSARPERDAFGLHRQGQGGPDGGFAIELEPGTYVLSASAEGYRSATVPLTVGNVAVDDVRFSLGRAMRIAGRVVDAAGVGISSVPVTALPDGLGDAANRATSRGRGQSQADGTFVLSDLAAGSYTISTSAMPAIGEEARFAVSPSIAAGTDDVLLRLAPGGRVRATAVQPDGSPSAGTTLGIRGLDGHPIDGHFWVVTNTEGVVQMMAPVGRVEIGVVNGPHEGSAEVVVGAGEPVTVRITVRPR